MRTARALLGFPQSHLCVVAGRVQWLRTVMAVFLSVVVVYVVKTAENLVAFVAFDAIRTRADGVLRTAVAERAEAVGTHPVHSHCVRTSPCGLFRPYIGVVYDSMYKLSPPR